MDGNPDAGHSLEVEARHPHPARDGFLFKELPADQVAGQHEEDRNGVITQFEGIPLEEHRESEVYPWKKVCQGYIDKDKIHRFDDNEVVIEYSETALNNLKELRNQLKKASIFLLNLVSSDDLELLIASNDTKLLN